MTVIIPINPTAEEKGVSSDTFIEFSINSKIDKSKLKVKINGEIAFINSDFMRRFAGDFSLYSEDEDSTNILVDPTFEFKNNKVIDVSIIGETSLGQKIYKNYSFKTDSLGPKILDSNFENGGVITKNQILYISVEDYDYNIDYNSLAINLNDTEIIKSGLASEDYSSGTAELTKYSKSFFVRITPDEYFRNGPYNFSISVSNENENKLYKNIKFNINLEKFIYPPIFPPSPINKFRIIEAAPVGDGKSIKIKWKDVFKRISNSNSYVLTYVSQKRLEILDSVPSCITIPGENNEIVLTDFSPGKQIYVLNRILETYADAFSFENLSTIYENTYSVPKEITVSDLFSSDDLVLKVSSTEGYPEKGLLVLGDSEVVKYTSINSSDNSFIIDPSGRGLNETSAGVFIDGDSVKLFLACQDSNLNIVSVTPTYSEEYSGTERNLVGSLVTNYEDQDKKFNQSYDYCGYHRHLPKLTLNGKDDCGSYLGGDFNGFRGFSIFDRMVAREEVLLDQTGEPCVLFKRKWTGVTCSCSNNNNRHPRQKTCLACFGTGFVDGFDQFINKKRSDTRLQLSFADTVEDLKLTLNKGYNIMYEPSCWTLPYPTIRDRDVILRFDYTNDAEYFYEVLDVSREKSICRNYTRQRVRLKRLEKTDIYQYLKYTKEW